jgi:hypothetical protein
MSVRATESLIAEVVEVTGIEGPRMVVSGVNVGEKTVSTIWFSDSNELLNGVFPAAALDKAEPLSQIAGKPQKKGK